VGEPVPDTGWREPWQGRAPLSEPVLASETPTEELSAVTVPTEASSSEHGNSGGMMRPLPVASRGESTVHAVEFGSSAPRRPSRRWVAWHVLAWALALGIVGSALAARQGMGAGASPWMVRDRSPG